MEVLHITVKAFMFVAEAKAGNLCLGVMNPRWLMLQTVARLTSCMGAKHDLVASSHAVCCCACQHEAVWLCRNNPQAFSNLLKRLIEASGRGMWQADDATLERLKGMYSDMDAQLEGIK